MTDRPIAFDAALPPPPSNVTLAYVVLVRGKLDTFLHIQTTG
jgi:hypothetical protein